MLHLNELMLSRVTLFVIVISQNVILNSGREVTNNSDRFYKLSLIHFNDFHARFEELSPASTKCEPSEAPCIGGFPRLYSKIHEMKKQTPDSVVLNAGDSFQGTLWYNIFKWNVTQYFMNQLPLDAHTLGNHDFDDAIAGVVPYIKSLNAPVIVSNINDTLEPTIQGLYQPTLVIERNNRKIGIIGIILSTTNEIARTEKLIFTDEIEAVKRESLKLTDEGVDIIIVLSHCGLDTDRMIAMEVGKYVDIIVGGHSHSLLYTGSPPNGQKPVEEYPLIVKPDPNSTVLIVQASAYTKYLGNLTVNFDSKGKIVTWEGVPIYLDNSVQQDAGMLKLMQPFKEEIDAKGKQQIGISKVSLRKSNCRQEECDIGNFVADSFVDFFTGLGEKGHWTYAAVAILNQGAMRTGLQIGPITYEDLVLIQPFSNYLCTFDILGKYLTKALEFSVSKSWSPDVFLGVNMLQVSGLNLTFNVTKPVGERIQSALIRCSDCEVPSYSPIIPEKLYKIAAPSFIVDGGRGYTVIKNNKLNTKMWGIDLDALTKYVLNKSPIITQLDGRIKVLT